MSELKDSTRLTHDLLLRADFTDWEQGWMGRYFNFKPRGSVEVRQRISIHLDNSRTCIGAPGEKEVWNIYVCHCNTVGKLRLLWKALTGLTLTFKNYTPA